MRRKFNRSDQTQRRQRGDTLVEVTIAITVMGIVVATSLAAMNRMLLSITNTTVRTSVRTEINSQIEMLYFVRDNQPETWKKLLKMSHGPTFGRDDCTMSRAQNLGTLDTDGSYDADADFWLVKDDADADNPVKILPDANTANDTNFADVNLAEYRPTPGKGIWISPIAHQVGGASAAKKYIDFYVKACWAPYGASTESTGSATKIINPSMSKTIVRIYDSEI